MLVIIFYFSAWFLFKISGNISAESALSRLVMVVVVVLAKRCRSHGGFHLSACSVKLVVVG